MIDEEASVEKTAAVEAIDEKPRSLETSAGKAAGSKVTEVSKERFETENVSILDDEFCSNDTYSQGKPSHASSSAPP